MQPLILIPARMGATRLPNKPMADIAGRPMIVHVWERAKQSGMGEVAVACDDSRIAEAIEKAGGKAVMTRSDHASGSDRIFEALQTLDPQKKYDVVINLQGDMPTIDPQIIQNVCSPLKNSAVDIATLAAVITDEGEKTDPAVVKAVFAADGRALYFTRATAPSGEGPLYHHIGIYAYRRNALEKFVTLPQSMLEKREKLEQLRAIEACMRIDVVVVDTVPLGVDTPETLEKARKFYERP